jgi:hypothetical protein
MMVSSRGQIVQIIPSDGVFGAFDSCFGQTLRLGILLVMNEDCSTRFELVEKLLDFVFQCMGA